MAVYRFHGSQVRPDKNLYVDERLDPYKSTHAAISYLKELHEIFGDWMTVLAAYNCGEGRVLRTIRNQNVSYLDDFWDLYQRLPYETARYVPKFMATLHIINKPQKYGLKDIVYDHPMQFDVQMISKQAYLQGHCKNHGPGRKRSPPAESGTALQTAASRGIPP